MVIPSFTVSLAEADRWWIKRNFPFFLGTRPMGEVTKFSRGGWRIGKLITTLDGLFEMGKYKVWLEWSRRKIRRRGRGKMSEKTNSESIKQSINNKVGM